MADVIKEAVIRLGIQQVPTTLVAPDIGPITEAARQMSDSVRQAMEAMQTGLSAVPNQAAPATQAIDAWSKGVNELGREWRQAEAGRLSWEAGLRSIREQQEATALAAEQLAAKQRLASDKIAQANLQILNASKQAGEGVLLMTRGLVLLGGSGTDALQKLLQGLALMQGALDVYKGAASILANLAQAQRAVAAATEAATVATAANTAATAANATAKGAAATATGAMAAGTVSLGAASLLTTPILVGVASAISAALLPLALVATMIAAVTYAYRQLAAAAELAKEKERDFAAGQQSYIDDLAASSRARIDSARQRAEGIGGFTSDADRAARQAALQSRVGLNTERIDDTSGGIEFRRDAASKALDQSVEIAKLQEQRVQAAEENLRIAEQTNQVELDAIRNADTRLQRAQEQLEVENARVRSMRAQLGTLDELEQAELRALAAKVQGGKELSNAELERLQQLGGGRVSEFVEGQFAERGAGLDQELENVFGGDEQDKLTQEVTKANEALAKLTDGLSAAEAIAKLEAERDAAVAEAQTAIEAMRALMAQFVEELQAVNKKVQAFEDGARS